jgi:hypothetical protein
MYNLQYIKKVPVPVLDSRGDPFRHASSDHVSDSITVFTAASDMLFWAYQEDRLWLDLNLISKLECIFKEQVDYKYLQIYRQFIEQYLCSMCCDGFSPVKLNRFMWGGGPSHQAHRRDVLNLVLNLVCSTMGLLRYHCKTLIRRIYFSILLYIVKNAFFCGDFCPGT